MFRLLKVFILIVCISQDCSTKVRRYMQFDVRNDARSSLKCERINMHKYRRDNDYLLKLVPNYTSFVFCLYRPRAGGGGGGGVGESRRLILQLSAKVIHIKK